MLPCKSAKHGLIFITLGAAATLLGFFFVDAATRSTQSATGLRGGDRAVLELVLERYKVLARNVTMRVEAAERAVMELRRSRTSEVAPAQPDSPQEAKPEVKEEKEESKEDTKGAEGGSEGAGAEGDAATDPPFQFPDLEDPEETEEERAKRQEAEEQLQNSLILYNKTTGVYRRWRGDFKCANRVPPLPDGEANMCFALHTRDFWPSESAMARLLQRVAHCDALDAASAAESLLSIQVALLSGRCAALQVKPSTKVYELRQRAQQQLHVGLKALVARGRLLKNACTLGEAGLDDGDTIHATARPGASASCFGFGGSHAARAFASIRRDGSVVSWGDKLSGGDCSAVQQSLTQVRCIRASQAAFTAVRGDGSCVTWGAPFAGGDSSAVQPELRHVKEIFASQAAFAAVREDGSVITWGAAYAGGDCRDVKDQLQEVHAIRASAVAFAAIKGDGHVVTWGMDRGGGDSSAVQEELVDIQDIWATEYAFAALRADGRVVTWGSPDHGGDCSSVREDLFEVTELRASEAAFAAIRNDGTCVAWGPADAGGTAPQEAQKVTELRASEGAFAALRSDGTVVTWGAAASGGDSSGVQERLAGVREICASKMAFAAIRGDGSVVAWGPWYAGGDASDVEDELFEVQEICATHRAFAARRRDGRVVTWGSDSDGGDSSAVQDRLHEVCELRASEGAFAAQRADGAVVTWGSGNCGGDSAAVKAVECTPGFDAPCCSALGWCGRSADHCKCEMCSDYRHKAKISFQSMRLHHAKRECETIAADLGEFTSPEDCAHSAVNDAECGKMIMYSFNYPNWGCRCCAMDTPTGDEVSSPGQYLRELDGRLVREHEISILDSRYSNLPAGARLRSRDEKDSRFPSTQVYSFEVSEDWPEISLGSIRGLGGHQFPPVMRRVEKSFLAQNTSVRPQCLPDARQQCMCWSLQLLSLSCRLLAAIFAGHQATARPREDYGKAPDWDWVVSYRRVVAPWRFIWASADLANLQRYCASKEVPLPVCIIPDLTVVSPWLVPATHLLLAVLDLLMMPWVLYEWLTKATAAPKHKSSFQD
ncbi:unnamed protein product [Effrenium voratum]|nr:unnamed protein product [Effrenium voratum]